VSWSERRGRRTASRDDGRWNNIRTFVTITGDGSTGRDHRDRPTRAPGRGPERSCSGSPGGATATEPGRRLESERSAPGRAGPRRCRSEDADAEQPVHDRREGLRERRSRSGTPSLVILTQTSAPYTPDLARGTRNRRNADSENEPNVRLLRGQKIRLSNPPAGGGTGLSRHLQRNRTV